MKNVTINFVLTIIVILIIASFPLQCMKEAKFLEWCNTHIPNVMRNKKPLSYAEYIQLQCDGFIPQKILDKLLYINAIAGFNRKYHDVYGVLKNWLNGDNDPNYYQKFKNKKKTDKAA